MPLRSMRLRTLRYYYFKDCQLTTLDELLRRIMHCGSSAARCLPRAPFTFAVLELLFLRDPWRF